jgi:hypothetical protein
MEKAVSGHGVFIYDAEATTRRYGSPALVAAALRECDMQHAWVRIHGATQTHTATHTRPLIDALRNNGIAVAGWGWCQGDQISVEVELALTSLSEFGLDHYVADIEEGVRGARWTADEVRTFLGSVREARPDAQLGVSSFGFIPWHEPGLMRAARDFVDFFAPQVYWFWFPLQRMLDELGVGPHEFPLNSPASYARLCTRAWRETVGKPLVVTGQAYWGENQDYTQDIAEAKVARFVETFQVWDELQGLNWWHMGGSGQKAMSFGMYQAIKAARLNGKFGG